MDGQAIRVVDERRAKRRGAPEQVPLTQEPGSAQRLTRRLVVARRAAAVANRAPPAVRELAIEIPDRVVVAFVAGAVTGVGHERVSRDRPKIPDLWRGVGHVSISAHRGLHSHVRVRRAMFVPRAAQPVRPSASLRACGSVVCTDGPSAAGSPPAPPVPQMRNCCSGGSRSRSWVRPCRLWWRVAYTMRSAFGVVETETVEPGEDSWQHLTSVALS